MGRTPGLQELARVSQRGRKDGGEREAKKGLQTRRGGLEEVEGRKEQGKVLGSTLSHEGGPDEGNLR